ncbi:MAG: SpoIIE family protein phosphatase [Bacteroidia bacterium]|nr:SpoIIE family protein phosphatase [Bacteroidia bacterium]
MKETCGVFWNKISRIGLREGEDALLFREVILLNRLLIVMFIVMLFYIPFEIAINGFKMVPAVLIMIAIAMFTLVFHHFRLFRLGHYYLYIFTSLFIVVMGLIVGRGINNHVVFMPIVLIAIIMFKSKAERIILFLIAVALFFLQEKLFDIIPPLIPISEDVKPLFSILFFILALILTFMVGFYFMGINKEYEGIIILQKENLEIKNKEITDSITYAKRIQTAILPPDSILKKHLKDFFILYLPKDVVAGDFYWLEHVNDVVLFAAADCTGHGVPGAMVSVVCNNALNRSVREEGLTEPGKILDRTREIIVHEFGKSNEDVKDGMDISLCALNTKTLEFKWAGANNPLWFIRNGELMEIKPDKQPIGQYFNSTPFTTHTTKLQTNDVLYLSTDGYQDQFGGEKGKKFKASNLKQMLLSHHNKSLVEQKNIILNSFVKWKGKNEQVDDVCVVGVKI